MFVSNAGEEKVNMEKCSSNSSDSCACTPPVPMAVWLELDALYDTFQHKVLWDAVIPQVESKAEPR